MLVGGNKYMMDFLSCVRDSPDIIFMKKYTTSNQPFLIDNSLDTVEVPFWQVNIIRSW